MKSHSVITILFPKLWSCGDEQCPRGSFQVFCRFDGANLASIHSEEENHFITALTRGDTHDFPQSWLGGFDAIQV